MAAIEYNRLDNGIVRLTIAMDGPVNVMNGVFRAALADVVSRLEVEDGLHGVIIDSARRIFLAGADLNEFAAITADDVADLVDLLDSLKVVLARLEALPVPVVAAINGAALGGGFELCLACDYRIAVADDAIRIGLPEVHLGLVPAAGGIVRMVRNLGLEQALTHLLHGSRLRPADALAAGLIDAIAADADALDALAFSLLREQPAVKRTASEQQRFALAQFIEPAATAADSLRLPAQQEIMQCAHKAVVDSAAEAYAAESRAVGRLITMGQTQTLLQQFLQRSA